MFWGGGLGERDRMEQPGRRSSWGPRYELLFVLWEPDSSPVTLRQYLYPSAADGRFGMWTFTVPDQPWYGEYVTAGWWLVSIDADRLLREHGLTVGAQRSQAHGFLRST